MKIKKLVTEHQILELNKITVLVGANNTGKSQTLRDIKDRMEKGINSVPIILKEIVFNKPVSIEDITQGLEIKNSPTTNKKLVGIKSNLLEEYEFEYADNWINSNFNSSSSYDFTLGNISNCRVSHLDSSTRLNLVKEVVGFNPNEQTPKNILQNLLIKKDCETLLQKAFKDAFKMDIKLDWSSFIKLNLLIDKKLPPIPDDPREAFPITKHIKKIDSEGDGFRSFVGIILAILLSLDRIILLDEPEAFLHPAQARYLGKWIADNSKRLNGQLIIATHSSNFLNGILSSENPVDIYRLNREDNKTIYNLIPAAVIQKLTKSALLSSQRVLEAIFHRGVVVCEADADRAIYQGVSAIEYDNQEILFMHSHNKQTIKDVVSLLKNANIPVYAITDIDILETKSDLKELIEAISMKKCDEELLKNIDDIMLSVNKVKEEDILNNFTKEVTELAQQLNKNEHTLAGAKGAYNRIRKGFNKWKLQKEKGINGFAISIIETVARLIDRLKKMGLFIVPVGELESWINLGTRKNKWIIPALETVYDGKTPENLKKFIKEIIDQLNSLPCPPSPSSPLSPPKA